MQLLLACLENETSKIMRYMSRNKFSKFRYDFDIRPYDQFSFFSQTLDIVGLGG